MGKSTITLLFFNKYFFMSNITKLFNSNNNYITNHLKTVKNLFIS